MKKKHFKNLLAGTVSAVMMCSTASAVYAEDSSTGTATEGKIIYSSDFEDGDVSAFSARNENDTTVISASEDNAVSGKKSLCASGRSQSWNGPAFSLEGKCQSGKAYLLSCKVMGQYYTSNTLSMQYTDSKGKEHYDNLQAVNGNGWQEIKDLKITFADGATNVQLYFEGGSDNIYIDDFVLKEAPVHDIQQDIASLKDVYSGYFKVGTAVTAKELSPQSTKDLILKQFNSITAGNELKPDAILDKDASLALAQSGDDENPQVSLESARSILNFARDNNIPVRGHVLVWHQQTPEWFFKENYDENGDWVSKEKMLVRMENYIKNVFDAVKTEYPDVDFYAWDVVNECLKDNGSPRDPGFPAQSNNYQSSPWVQIFGDNSFIKPAFEFAKKYAPEGTKLYYNDYNEYMDKKDAIVALTEEINSDGHYIDGIGMQSHLDARSGSDAFPSASMYKKALDQFCATGLDVQITELDATVNGNDEESFKKQAQYYSDIMDAIVEHKDDISAVVFWGTTDDQSWRASGYPLLFNEDYSAKESFYSIVDDIEPLETTTTTTNSTESSTTTTTTTTTTGTTDPTNTPARLYGDADSDGEVNINDAVLIMQSIANPDKYHLSEDGKLCADTVDNGGGITNADALAIQYVESKTITPADFPITSAQLDELSK
ncbi:MAG: endo-1,4-beta-xylanase [Ruminococcus sp.]|nr:endo-1,4-beta-xylanase [Ruminococcus sp.]